MSEFFFILKCFVFTIVLVLLMQIKVGRQTVEQHSLNWMHESAAIGALRGVADGASMVIENSYQWIHHTIEKQFGGSSPSSSHKRDSTQERQRQRERAWQGEAESSAASAEPDVD